MNKFEIAAAIGPARVPALESRSVGNGVGAHAFYEVEISLLGPVVVRGAARPFTRAWSLDLVVYLALHPGSVRSDIWATALWPDRVMAAPTLHSIASSARRALGCASSGRDHLPRGHGSLQLEATVGTDWDLFRDLAAKPDPDLWRAALCLVRGRPLQGLRSSDWAIFDGTVTELEEGVVSLAERLGEYFLEVGSPREATCAARLGLRASPYDERLYRLVMRAADEEGNPAGVEAAMRDLICLLGGTGALGRRSFERDGADLFDLVHPETAYLYETLSRRHRPSEIGESEGVGRRTLARL
ncbi:MAG: AfsR/SARP family transcriptional regulator [Acidimicrobiales bacterium]